MCMSATSRAPGTSVQWRVGHDEDRSPRCCAIFRRTSTLTKERGECRGCVDAAGQEDAVNLRCRRRPGAAAPATSVPPLAPALVDLRASDQLLPTSSYSPPECSTSARSTSAAVHQDHRQRRHRGDQLTQPGPALVEAGPAGHTGLLGQGRRSGHAALRRLAAALTALAPLRVADTPVDDQALQPAGAAEDATAVL